MTQEKMQELHALRAENARLREALRPFAEYIEHAWDLRLPDTIILTDYENAQKYAIRVRHFAAARTAMEPPK